MVGSLTLVHDTELRKENTLNSRSYSSSVSWSREDLSEYVAHLQLHMALQARNLVPTLTQTTDSRQELLQQTQANFEKLISRQGL
jgi:DnaJ-domain-containing protein 1